MYKPLFNAGTSIANAQNLATKLAPTVGLKKIIADAVRKNYAPNEKKQSNFEKPLIKTDP